jgi:hypothetical protein
MELDSSLQEQHSRAQLHSIQAGCLGRCVYLVPVPHALDIAAIAGLPGVLVAVRLLRTSLLVTEQYWRGSRVSVGGLGDGAVRPLLDSIRVG